MSTTVITRADVEAMLRRAGDDPKIRAIFLLGWLSNRVSPKAERILLHAMEHLAFRDDDA